MPMNFYTEAPNMCPRAHKKRLVPYGGRGKTSKFDCTCAIFQKQKIAGLLLCGQTKTDH